MQPETTPGEVSVRVASDELVDEVLGVLRDNRGEIGFVIQVPGGARIEPQEVWLGGIGCWVRVDGFSICQDYGRGYSYPSGEHAAKIAKAVNDWSRAHLERQTHV